uniref:Uncharacterized conserved protein, DUF697 family n=1 Tax=Candidatus Kentrum eta TaxID=2126337 RepID=A0A450UJQ8_9GAMM|nr:MAG: Uncharacterized conserved protein, DUF697 family [Candidatus Kentron sp. H]VFJ93284.1 MAG: Uncharacterized conserved protein, DUF697 family [Candidatus Kentron sp. H]VFK00431.1 MAG: Uncharacterized conserved protein, DUF697 family [Candidatus Kentron sp. H]
MTIDMIEKESPEESSESIQKTGLEREIANLKLSNGVGKTIRRHIASASAIGLLPIPLFDMAALIAIQMNLIRKIAKAYNVPFTKNKVRTIVTSLVSAVLPTVLTPAAVASFSKAIPAAGTTVGVVTMPILAGAATYATGRIFVLHFESGGTFLNFDVEKIRKQYAEMFKKGKDVVSGINAEEKEPTSATAAS